MKHEVERTSDEFVQFLFQRGVCPNASHALGACHPNDDDFPSTTRRAKSTLTSASCRRIFSNLPPFIYDLTVFDCLHDLAAALRHGVGHHEEYETMEALLLPRIRVRTNRYVSRLERLPCRTASDNRPTCVPDVAGCRPLDDFALARSAAGRGKRRATQLIGRSSMRRRVPRRWRSSSDATVRFYFSKKLDGGT